MDIEKLTPAECQQLRINAERRLEGSPQDKRAIEIIRQLDERDAAWRVANPPPIKLVWSKHVPGKASQGLIDGEPVAEIVKGNGDDGAQTYSITVRGQSYPDRFRYIKDARKFAEGILRDAA